MAETIVTATPAPAPRKRRRWLRILLWSFGVFVALLVALYFVATSSAFVKGVILPRLSASLNADVTVRDVSVHPFREIVLHDLKVQAKGQEPFLTAAEVRAQYHLLDILRGRLHVDAIILQSPSVSLITNPDGTTNIDPLTEAQKKNPKERKQSSSEPAQLDIGKISLTDATIRRIQKYAGGQQDEAVLSKVNLSVDRVKNGESGKVTVSADVNAQNNAPKPNGQGLLEGTINGEYTFALLADLKPASVQGRTQLKVSRAEGNLADFAAFAANLDCDVTPTEVKRVALQFQKGNETLAELRASGPLDLAKSEGRLKVELLSLDRRLLNLFGASSGMDFGSTTIQSTNEIQLAGGNVTATGNFTAQKVQVIRAGQATPAVDFQVRYDVALNGAQKQSADIRDLQIALTPTQRAKNQIQLQGHIDLSAAATPQGNLKITADSLDLTSYYDLFGGDTNAPAKKKPTRTTNAAPHAVAAAPAAEPGPMHLPVRNLALDLNLGRIYLRELDISNLTATVKVDDTHIQMNSFQFTLNGGNVNATADIDVGLPGYHYEVTLAAARVPVAPFVNSFSETYRNRARGELAARLQVKGTGTTGLSLQKNLAAQGSLVLTNANVKLAGKLLNNVITPIATALRIPEVADSPINWMVSDVNIADGKINLTAFRAAGEAFAAETHGTVPIAEALNESPIADLPINFSLSRNLAERAHFQNTGPDGNNPYVDLGPIAHIEGTLGKMQTRIDYTKLALWTGQQYIGGAAGQLLRGLDGGNTNAAAGVLNSVGGLLSRGGTNTSNTKTNQNQSPVNNLLNNFLKPK